MKNVALICVLVSVCLIGVAAQQPSPAPSVTVNSTAAEPTPTPSPKTGSATVAPNTEPEAAVTETIAEPATKPAARYAAKDAPVRIPRFETAPVIDGEIKDGVWQNAAMFGDFLQTQPGDNITPPHQTEVMMGYDSKHLYIAFHVKQDRDKVRSSIARRDNIFNDDYIGVYLDTFNDQRQAYTFFFNPLGVQADGIFTEGRGEDYSVDLVYESKGTLTPDGFIIEAAIPFKSLRYEAGENKNWRIQIFRRVKYNNNELDSWMPIKRGTNGTLNQAGQITGLEGISTTRQLEINPSVTFSYNGNRNRTIPVADIRANPALQDPAQFNYGFKTDIGFTAKFGLTPTTTLDFAYNPDFAQVEADAPVVTANQRFPIFFAEKRPFFLERIDIFQTRMNIVNTRAIVDPDIAAKLTGRRGKNTFGLLYASDKHPGFGAFTDDQRTDPTLRRGIERSLGKNADIGVLRVKRDVGRQSNVGAFATTYNFVDRHNNTAGFDGRFRFDPRTVAEFQLIGTNTRGFFYDSDLNRRFYRTGNGFGYSYMVERSGRNLFVTLNGVGRTRDYRADVGFTPRTDTNQHRAFIRYETERDPKKSIIFKRLSTDAVISHDWRGRTQNYQSNTQGMLALQNQIFIGGGLEFGYDRVFESEFGANRTATRPGAFFGDDSERSAHRQEVYGFVEASPTKQLFFFGLVSQNWNALDFDFGAGPDFPRASQPYIDYLAERQRNPNAVVPALDPGAGSQLFIEGSVRYQPTNELQAQLNYTKTRLVRNDTGLTAFDDNIFSLRSTYQFSRDVFARLRVDYSTLGTRFSPQIILGWTPNPGTAIYVGYNDSLNYNGYNQFTGQYESGFRRNGNSFFIKASYLFRKSF